MNSSSAVTATALGEWPGTDPLEANRIIRGELGEPHLPHLVSLPHRGPGSDAVGRTAAMLIELPVDLQPHGWRLTDHAGKDQQRAVSALSTDLNVLGDLIGAEANPGSGIKIHLRGPLSMAANLHLHNGERALLDHGARREVYGSLAVGVEQLVQRVRALALNAAVHVQVDEPEIAQVMSGRIPTASGYRTLRAVQRQEVTDAWETLARSVRATGAGDLILTVSPDADALSAFSAGTYDGIALPLADLSGHQWENIAAHVEAGRKLWAGVVDPGGTVPQVSALVDSLVQPWRGIGLPFSSLGQVRLTPTTGMAGVSPQKAQQLLRRLTQAADAVNQIVAED